MHVAKDLGPSLAKIKAKEINQKATISIVCLFLNISFFLPVAIRGLAGNSFFPAPPSLHLFTNQDFPPTQQKHTKYSHGHIYISPHI